MDNQSIIQLIGFVVAGIAVVTPIVKLNVNVARLGCSIDELRSTIRHSKERTDAHSAKLDNHENRITILETDVEHLKGCK